MHDLNSLRCKHLASMSLALFLLLIPVLTACRNEEIVAYESLKTATPTTALESINPKVSWNLPERWKKLSLSGMRVGNFLIEGSEDKNAEVSVIPLAGSAGGHLANVNRWRSQLRLEPISQAELEQQLKIITSPAGDIILVDFVSSEPLIDGKFKSRLIAAMLSQGDMTWFFKMTGEDSLVSSSRREFEEFLASIRVSTND